MGIPVGCPCFSRQQKHLQQNTPLRKFRLHPCRATSSGNLQLHPKATISNSVSCFGWPKEWSLALSLQRNSTTTHSMSIVSETVEQSRHGIGNLWKFFHK